VVAVSEEVQETLKQDEEEGRKEEMVEAVTQSPIEVQASLAEEDRSDGEEGDAISSQRLVSASSRCRPRWTRRVASMMVLHQPSSMRSFPAPLVYERGGDPQIC
jgi:hypothetical protein